MSRLYELIRDTGIIPAEGQTFFMDDKIHSFRILGEKEHKSSGKYKIKQNPDGRYIGWVYDHRQKIKQPIKAGGTGRMMTPTERTVMMLQKQIQEAARKEAIEQVSKKARDFWSAARSVNFHPYALRKGIPLRGARVYKELLLIPIYGEDWKVCNLQIITADGTKRFLKGGQKQGCMGAIAPRDGIGLNKIYVVEGWATGVSVWLATGCAIAIAFDCGNLRNVVDTLRERHPASKIILAGDNDQWGTKPDGTPFNAGEHYGLLCGSDEIILPPFPCEHPKKLTDWNDFANEQGYERLSELLNV